MTAGGGPVQVTAPWTQDQVDSLNSYQVSGAFHPFTGNNDLLPLGENDVLVADVDGWHSTVDPGYRQTWAWGWMADWSWKELAVWPPTPKRRDEELWDLIGNARVVIWFCPKRDDDQHSDFDKGKPTVEWSTDDDTKKMTPVCLVCGETGEPR